MHGIQSFLYLFFCFIDHKLYKFVQFFFNHVNIMWEYMHKGQERANVKVCYEFGNDSMKMCLEHKTRMKIEHRIKNIKITYNCVFLHKF